VFALFAGDAGAATASATMRQSGELQALGGLQALADYIEGNIALDEREQASQMLVRLIGGALFELMQLVRERDGLAALPPDAQTQSFMTHAMLALSEVQIYPAPMIFELRHFDQVQASVFQIARAPGKNVVYLGCALLILGIFAMLYVRERRLWIWLTPQPTQTLMQTSTAMTAQTQATMALSINRKTLDAGREFVHLQNQLLGTVPHGGSA